MLVVSCLITACQPPAPVQNFVGLAQGSSYQVSFHSGDHDIDSGLLQRDIEAELREIDRLMSNYRDDSVIEQFNREQNTGAVCAGCGDCCAVAPGRPGGCSQ